LPIVKHFEDDEAVVDGLAEAFIEQFAPLEADSFHLLQDRRKNAVFAECHIKGDQLLSLGTIDVPLDPENSPDYRANRELVENHPAFMQMKTDAIAGRSFSGIVCEFIAGDEKPLKIIGGQHRYEAIAAASDSDVHEWHGVKVYFGLDKDQRLDVQVISNTNIAVSRDLLDRMYETLAGSELRDWCQRAGLLDKGEDFSDKRKRGNSITVGFARNLIINFYRGLDVDPLKFDRVDTTPIAVPTGQREPVEWRDVKAKHPELWTDKRLLQAGQEYAALIAAQEKAFTDNKSGKAKSGFADSFDKASSLAVLTAWSFVAGVLQKNPERLTRHYNLKNSATGDPLKAAALAKGKHATDTDTYRGLGYRTDAKERGRFVELFWLQAEKGTGISPKLIDAAIGAYHAKDALLEAEKLKNKL
jgi:hypothetical protein